MMNEVGYHRLMGRALRGKEVVGCRYLDNHFPNGLHTRHFACQRR